MRQRSVVRPAVVALVVLGCLAAGAVTVAAGQPPPQGQPLRQGQQLLRGAAQGQAGEWISLVEVQRLFDAYTIMQAETALKLTEAQYPQFIGRLRTLQDTRRRNMQARQKVIQQLARLTNPQAGAFDEAQVKEALRALADLEVRAAAELRSAYEALDQALDVRQRARFRILEEQLERRKIDLVARARRNAPGDTPQKPPPIIK